MSAHDFQPEYDRGADRQHGPEFTGLLLLDRLVIRSRADEERIIGASAAERPW